MSDWSSDVCSPDLEQPASRRLDREVRRRRIGTRGKVDQSFLETEGQAACQMTGDDLQNRNAPGKIEPRRLPFSLWAHIDQTRGVHGERVSVRVDIGDSPIIKKKTKSRQNKQ